MGDLRAHLPTLYWVFPVFDQKWRDAHTLPSLFTQSQPEWLFFVVILDENVLEGRCFANVEELKQKMVEALKGIKIDKFKTVLSSGKNVSIGVLHQMESTMKVAEVQNM